MSLRFRLPVCPDCGEEPTDVVTRVSVLEEIGRGADGTDHFADHFEIDWEVQEMLPAGDDTAMRLLCPHGHEWDSRFEEIGRATNPDETKEDDG